MFNRQPAGWIGTLCDRFYNMKIDIYQSETNLKSHKLHIDKTTEQHILTLC